MTEPVIPELDYLSVEPVQHAITQRNSVYIEPVSDTYKSGGDLKFEIPLSECSTPCHELKVYLEVKVVKADGSACNHNAATNPDDVSVVNNLFHSMWKQCTATLNGHEQDKVDNYNYLAYVSLLTSYSPEVLRGRGELIGWNKDSAGAFNEKSLTLDSEVANKNFGLIRRTEPYKNSNVVELVGRIDCDLLNQGRSMPPNTSVLITLTRASNEFVLMTKSTTQAYKLEIVKAKLEVPRDKLAPSLHQSMVEMVDKYNLSINYRHRKVVTCNLAKDTFSGTFTNAFSSSKYLPDRIVAFIVTNKAFSGSYDTNPFEFRHCNLKRIAAVVNENTVIPTGGYKPNFAAKKVAHEYMSLLREFNADEENFMLDISKNDFCNGYTIFPFRIVPRTRGGDVLGPPATGTISIEYEFNAGLEVPCTLVLIGDFRGTFEIREGGDFAPVSTIPQ